MKGKLNFSRTQELVAKFSDVAYRNAEGKTPFGVFCYATVSLSSSEGKKNVQESVLYVQSYVLLI